MNIMILMLAIFYLSLSTANSAELTLNDCIEMALENNSGLKAFKTDVVSSGEDVNASRAEFFPSLKLQGNYTVLDRPDITITKRDAFGPGMPREDVELSAENRNMYGASLSIEQPIFTGGQLTHTFRKSKTINEETHYRVERQKRLLVFEVKRAFYEALKEQLYRETLEKIIGFKKERLRVLQERYKEGYAYREDVLMMETDLSASELDIYKTKNREGLAISRLKRFMYYNGDDEFHLKGNPVNGFLTASLQEIKESAIKNRDDLRMSIARIKAAGEGIDIAKSGFYPRVSLQGRYTMQKETNITRPDVWMFTAQLDWPLFEWSKTKSEVKKAEAVNQRLKYEHKELIKAIELEAENAWRTVKEKEKEVEFNEKRLKAAEYRYKRTMDRYAEKVVKLADLVEMEAEFIKAYNDYTISINDLDISLAHLEASTSTAVEKWFSTGGIYRPDFQSLSNTVNEPVTKNIEGALKGEKSNTESAEKRTVSPATYAVQVASFRTREDAEKLRKKLLNRIHDKKIIIHNNGGFHKVRITGFKDREEADEVFKDLKIRDYLIVRTGNGR
jgi:outer membrane protein TolC